MVTKSGKETHGLNSFFSGLEDKVVKGIAIFYLSLGSVEERRSYLLLVEQVVRSEAEKEVAKEHKQRQTQKAKTLPRKSVITPKAAKTGIKPRLN